MARIELVEEKKGRGNPEYDAYLCSKRWRKLARAVKLRAKGKCEICRRRDGHHCAHLTYDRIFHEHIEDLLWLCRRCHGDLDQRDKESTSSH